MDPPGRRFNQRRAGLAGTSAAMSLLSRIFFGAPRRATTIMSLPICSVVRMEPGKSRRSSGNRGANAVQRLDHSGTKHVCSLKRQTEQGVLSLSLYSRPHHTSLLRTVGSCAGDVNKGHAGIQAREGLGRRQGDPIGYAVVVGFAHSRRRNAQAKETGIETGEIAFDDFVVQQVEMRNFTQFLVKDPRDIPADRLNTMDPTIEEAFAEHPLPDHSGGAKDEHIHWGTDANPVEAAPESVSTRSPEPSDGPRCVGGFEGSDLFSGQA